MIKNLPIKTKLSLQFSIFTSIILGVLGFIIYFSYLNVLENDRKNILIIEYENIKNSIGRTNYTKDGLELEEQTVDNIDKATNLGLLIFIYDKYGNIVESTSSIEGDIFKNKDGFFKQNINSQKYIFYSGEHKGLKIIIGLSLEIYYKNISILAKVIIISFFLVLFLTLLFSYIFSKKALSPINGLINDIDKINIKDDSTSQISKNYLNDEIGILAKTFDKFINKIKESINKEKELYEDINHELRTPVMVISSSIELLQTTSLNDFQKEKIEMIEDNSKKMEKLINELLFLNRNDLSKDIEEKIKVGELIKSIALNFKTICEKKGIFIDIIIKKDFELFSNGVVLDKLFGNLIKNAIFYTEKGKVEIIIENKKVSIMDTGIGIDKEDLENIWDRFYRSEKSRNNKLGGFGLGLSIVKKITQENNWKIEVKSEIGIGSDFIIEF